MKSKLLALALGLAACAAQAAPSFSFTNVPAGWDGQYSVKLTGYETFAGSPFADGTQNFGVLRVTGIYTLDGDPLWVQGQGGAEITGVFSGITVNGAASGGSQLNATGGSASFFINPVGSLTGVGGFAQGLGGYGAAGCSINTNCYNGISNVAGGGSFLDASYVPGISALFPNITVAGSLTNSNPLTGTATGYLAATGGTYKDMFDTNGYLSGAADMIAKNSFYTVGEPGGGSQAAAGGPGANAWTLRIDDPITGSVKLPEPASLALVGLGLLGAGLARRRKSA